MHSKIKEYSYKPTLEKPLTYQYAQFLGYGFIKSYKLFRFKIITLLESRISRGKLTNIVPRHIKNLEFDDSNPKALLKKISRGGATKNILSLLLLMQYKYVNKDEEMQEHIYKWLSIFIKKYEVSKKIFTQYDSKMKKIGNDYKKIENYLLLSANLAIFYKHSGNLKFLNTLLKLNDTLCSISKKITQKNLPLFYLSLKIELEEVKNLFNKRGFRL